ncbi:MAG: hypothetical protein KJ063_00135 [Anaerolineae bacterium]|nr:hypothetical protein [Anaerolineae bacterium]
MNRITQVNNYSLAERQILLNRQQQPQTTFSNVQIVPTMALPTGPSQTGQILALQRTIGNRATQRVLQQKTAAALEAGVQTYQTNSRYLQRLESEDLAFKREEQIQQYTQHNHTDGLQRNCRDGHEGPAQVPIYSCTRSAFFRGNVATHKYLWRGDTQEFCGMGNAQSEKGPEGDTCKTFWVDPQQAGEVMQVCRNKKAAADEKLWVPYINDCHKVVEQTLTETGIGQSNEMGRFGGKPNK